MEDKAVKPLRQTGEGTGKAFNLKAVVAPAEKAGSKEQEAQRHPAQRAVPPPTGIGHREHLISQEK